MNVAERRQLTSQIVALLMQYTWAGRKQFVGHLAEHGLTPPQFYVLAFLVHQESDNPGAGGCPIHQVAAATRQERATMTGIVDRLERAGLLERSRSQEDRRMWLVSPTTEGRRLIIQAGETWHGHMLHAFDELDAQELAQFHGLLRRLVEATSPADLTRLPAYLFAGSTAGHHA